MKMNKSLIKLISLIIFLIAINSNVFAQVSVHLQQPPPYQFKVEQFWKFVLINSSDRPVNVYIKGTATESLQGKIIEATSSIITLQKGIKAVSGRELGPFTISESNSRYKNIILNTGGLPSGSYNICIEVLDAANGKQLATDCISVTVENFNRMELTSPFDGEVIGNISEEATYVRGAQPVIVKGDLTGNENLKLKSINKTPPIIFSWLPPVPVPPGARISYRLKIVEILGYQSVHSAMASNPMYYQSPRISATVLRYPIAAMRLMPGRKYAWSVEAFVDDFKIQESEIRSFEIAGSDEKLAKYSRHHYAGSINRYGDGDFNSPSGLPSGLSSYSNKSFGTSSLNLFRSAAPIDLFGSPGTVVFSGDAKFTQISSSKPAQFSQLPLSYQTFEINPRLSIYDIPFGMNVYLSSLNNSNRQSLNSVSFILDLDRLKSNIKDRISNKIQETQFSANLYLEKLKDLKALSDPAKIKDFISEKKKEIQSSADSSLDKLKEIQALSDPAKIKDLISEKIKRAQASADSSLGKLKEIEALNDPNKLAENAGQLGLISSAEKFFMNIKTFGIGRTYPDYSELTVSGVPVNGLNLEYNPGIFYFAVAAGNNSDGIDNISFKRSFVAGRIGLGEKENTHFFFTLLKMKDDLNSIQVSSSNSFLTPQENVVFGSEGKVNLFKNAIEINGEAAVSGFTSNLNDADFVSESIPGFINNLLTPKLSTSFDYAWKGKIAFNHESSATFLSLGAKRIGPGFMSLAAPNLRQDQFQIDANFDQKFADRKITLKTFFRIYNDNLINWKLSTTTTTSYGINLGFYFPNIPFVQINYSPYSQSNDNVIAAQKMKNTFNMFSLMTGYSYQFLGLYVSTMLSFNEQWQNSQVGINSTKFSNTSFMLNQSLNFEFPLTLSSTLSLSQSKILSISSNITEFDLNGSYQLSENISANLGGTISNEENLTKRVLVSLGSNIIVSKLLSVQLQGNISSYKDLSGTASSYNDAMFQLSALLHW
ncbi:MAG: hypothetical protein ACOYU5_10545 [Stygiobacter sp.]